MSVRVRYAPSPTGKQHIGSVRTALFNYLFAKSQGGVFFLRIEDTDQERSTEGSIQNLYDTLNWLGITWQEGPDKDGPFGPYTQSERIELYQKYAKKLVDDGFAYFCFCTPEDQKIRDDQKEGNKKQTGYDRFCRNLTEDEVKAKLDQGLSYVIRLKIPEEGKTIINDLLIGEIKRKNKDVSPDPVMLKSDGFPTYHLAHVIDDHLMETSHVIRGQEWIPSGPIHIILFNAFGWDVPQYVHLPLIIGKDGQKLSKRHGATSISEFIEKGYLPEAMMNYLSLVGWSFDDSREFFTKDELEKLFNLEKINKASGTFDYKKLDWFNGQYIRKLTIDDLEQRCMPYLEKAALVSTPPTVDQKVLIDKLMPLVQERMKVLSDVTPLTAFIFKGAADYEPAMLIPKKADKDTTLKAMNAARKVVADVNNLTDEAAEEKIKALSEEMEVKIALLLMPIRISLTGSPMSLPLFPSIRLLGVDESLQRVDAGIKKLSEYEGE